MCPLCLNTLDSSGSEEAETAPWWQWQDAPNSAIITARMVRATARRPVGLLLSVESSVAISVVRNIVQRHE